MSCPATVANVSRNLATGNKHFVTTFAIMLFLANVSSVHRGGGPGSCGLASIAPIHSENPCFRGNMQSPSSQKGPYDQNVGVLNNDPNQMSSFCCYCSSSSSTNPAYTNM